MIVLLPTEELNIQKRSMNMCNQLICCLTRISFYMIFVLAILMHICLSQL